MTTPEVPIEEFVLEDDSDYISDVRPTISETNGDRSVTPVYTEEFEAVTENDNVRHQSLCGETKVEPVGEYEWRLKITGTVIERQLEELIEMRPAGQAVDVTTDIKTYEGVNFDRFRFRQRDEYQRGNFNLPDTGASATERVYTFTLQMQGEGNGSQ